jgi:glycosyltransferase involved in cell wall biosynthesis
VVGFVGRLTTIKRPDRFIEIARLAQRRLPGTHFVLAGDGPLASSLRSASADLTNVTFLGWRADVGNVLAACDVVVLCSDNEGMPVVLIEAGYLGTAAVAARVGSVHEVLEDGVGGILVPADDLDAYLRAIEGVLTGTIALDPRRAAESATQRFSPSFAADAHERLYRELLYSRR